MISPSHGDAPVSNLPAPVRDDQEVPVSARALAMARKHPDFRGTVTRGGATFAVFSKRPTDAIIKGMKDAI